MHPLSGVIRERRGPHTGTPACAGRGVRDPALGFPAAWSCTKAATHSKQIHHATERRKVRQKQEQKLTLKGRGGKEDSDCEWLPEKVGGCCAAKTWDFRGCTLIFYFSLVQASLLRWQKAAVLRGRKTEGRLNRRDSVSSCLRSADLL